MHVIAALLSVGLLAFQRHFGDAFRVALPSVTQRRFRERLLLAPSSGNRRPQLALFSFLRDDDVLPVTGIHKRHVEDELDWESVLSVSVPALTPVFGFLLYQNIAEEFAHLIDILGQNNWVPVDGGAYLAKSITPALNGIVLPSISLLFATLTSTTISNLRDRQLRIRNAINQEAGELRNLESLFQRIPPGSARKCLRDLLVQYITRVTHECSPEAADKAARTLTDGEPRGTDSELYNLANLLNEQEEDDNGVVSSNVHSQSIASIAMLREQRLNRLSSLQSTFPVQHFVIMFISAFAQCTAFLMETNTSTLAFLSALQLKVMWSMLTTTFMACFVVFEDLASPFSGSYQILDSVEQLYMIRSTLEAAIREEDEAGEK